MVCKIFFILGYLTYLALGQRFVCYEEKCTGDINNASPHCHQFCKAIGYTYGHCANHTREANPDYERRQRGKRQAPAGVIDAILGARGPSNTNGRRPSDSNDKRTADSNQRNAARQEEHASEFANLSPGDWTKHGNECQCYNCNKKLCDAYCESSNANNCLDLGQLVGINMEVCGCGIDTNSGDNLLDIVDTLCQ